MSPKTSLENFRFAGQRTLTFIPAWTSCRLLYHFILGSQAIIIYCLAVWYALDGCLLVIGYLPLFRKLCPRLSGPKLCARLSDPLATSLHWRLSLNINLLCGLDRAFTCRAPKQSCDPSDSIWRHYFWARNKLNSSDGTFFFSLLSSWHWHPKRSSFFLLTLELFTIPLHAVLFDSCRSYNRFYYLQRIFAALITMEINCFQAFRIIFYSNILSGNVSRTTRWQSNAPGPLVRRIDSMRSRSP